MDRAANKLLRYSLIATGLMNMFGAALFAPFLPQLRDLYSLPASHPLYLWIISAWIMMFGFCYLWLGIKGGSERLFLVIGSAGKLAFVAVMFGYWFGGEVPIAAALGSLSDLFFAIVFLSTGLRTRSSQSVEERI